MNNIFSVLNPKSHQLIKSWINELNVKVKLSKERKTKLGDFKVYQGNMYITINDNLNKYSFLITLVHELAHAYVYVQYKNTVNPHGKEWKNKFKSLMLNFLSNEYFPDVILSPLSKYLISPKASTYSDLDLAKSLQRYDNSILNTILEINEKSSFFTYSGRKFVILNKLRKRYKCKEISTGKVYLFHPLTQVKMHK
tara:strand:- start:31 stop:618 length:588 start_codon:yes stop_codon:yes gene_type:complete